MIEVKDLSYSYSGHQPVLTNFDFDVKRGESWAVIGPSGCGKTTLLYLLAGLRKRTSGHILISGRDISRPRPKTGLILQDHGLLPWATVEENALLGFKIRGLYGPDGMHAPKDEEPDPLKGRKEVDYWLKRLGIEEFRDKYPSQLSRGQRQRTAIARTLALSPDLLLMDEPFSALDAVIRLDLQKTMIELQRERDLTSILVTHDIEEAIFVGEKILVLNGLANNKSTTIDNNISGKLDYRTQPEFQERLDHLRRLLRSQD